MNITSFLLQKFRAIIMVTTILYSTEFLQGKLCKVINVRSYFQQSGILSYTVCVHSIIYQVVITKLYLGNKMILQYLKTRCCKYYVYSITVLTEVYT